VFWRDESGVTAIEYAIMASMIAMVIVTAVINLGQTALTQLFDKVASSM
jgi:pilus assembly protein Flp/PilA